MLIVLAVVAAAFQKASLLIINIKFKFVSEGTHSYYRSQAQAFSLTEYFQNRCIEPVKGVKEEEEVV